MSNKSKIKVAVGLSGGVDSAVSAYLLKEEGYDVVGVYMQCWDAKADGCTAEEDRADAAKVAAHLGIKFKSLDFVKEYKENVIEHFYDEYKAGRTPNPDVLCNKEIKFGMFLDWAVAEGFNYVATGHYARVIEDVGEFKLLRGIDDSKDQSYFLYLLNQDQLSKTLFPLGLIKKEKVREIAEEVGFHNADKADSVGICFIGEVDIKEFLKKRIDEKLGDVVNKDGEVIGDHDGVWFYTIGQRHGFRTSKYHGMPLYVTGKDVGTNQLIVGYAKDGERENFEVDDVHWIGKDLGDSLDCTVRIRHLGELYEARYEEGLVKLKYPTFGVAPGQSAVFYVGEHTVGGGVIK
ncbi:tRNA 2-thiouridine(34) synthase MnmA [candidate division WWE3 bacterium]|jgi:tRNA-uridine 2-sulfurtransferase|nr:tRNA 2-thiouridine(34) synthase MnmA [candidate division WWE3 bacterium]MBT7350200.1 tRNA 2-thiouridine(34) synthase MnmA [candidate division WWE3 bacterium]